MVENVSNKHTKTMINPIKAQLYKTAKAAVSCAKFKAGEFVSVEWSHASTTGTNWFLITRTEHGQLEYPVAYPEHHLSDFCL